MAKTSKADGQRRPKWTVMVFMAAETVVGSVPLHAAAASDLKEMEYVGSGGDLNIFAQLHGRGVPRRYHIGGAAEDVPQIEREQADGLALGYFVDYALRTARHRPEDHSLLVLWGHAYDFAFGRSRRSDGGVEALEFVTLARLLATLQQRFREQFVAQYPDEEVPEAPKLDILAFDACDLSTVEVACQLQPFASYLLASEIGVPIPGWPYDRAFKRFRRPLGRPMGPAEAGNWIIRRFSESYIASKRIVSLTLLDLERAAELTAYSNVLTQALLEAIGQDSAARNLIASLFFESRTGENRPYVDLGDLCLNLMRNGRDPMVAKAAEKLGDFLISPGPRVVGGSAQGLGKPFIAAHGRNAAETARLNGLSIYAPHVAPRHDAGAVRATYEAMEFARQTNWSALVHTLAGVV
jgi:hypothetical protein